ncbi:hypothetical protein ILUMI_10077 [Ignelater luminosus]|uniref:Uncharacterized protein n=1 Tax=Ignelater luminosus TaxID=2038154 RepID=A0A8K0GDY5_IGNLU|nr:hypothetical protein ILUMI_10077 [Ignelater luminosus]
MGQYLHFYSGVKESDRAKRGVSIVIHFIKGWQKIDERIISVELKKNGHNIVIIGVCAPTDAANKEVKDKFYDNLTKLLNDVHSQKIGAQNSNIVGEHGKEAVNDTDLRLIELCETRSLIINGFYPHKNIHKYTWIQPTRKLRSIIDYVIQRQNLKLRTQNARVYRKAKCGSHHFMVQAKVLITHKTNNKLNRSQDTRTWRK